MQRAPIIRKDVYKDYLNPAIHGGFFIAILFAVISLSMRSILCALLIGLYIWIGIITVLKRENLKLLSKEEWEDSFGKELKLQREKRFQQKN